MFLFERRILNFDWKVFCDFFRLLFSKTLFKIIFIKVKMKEMKSSEVFRFKFNRWMSRLREDGATLREQPVTSADGKPVLPSKYL